MRIAHAIALFVFISFVGAGWTLPPDAASRYNVDTTSYYIDTAAGEMTFTDPTTGTMTLSDLASTVATSVDPDDILGDTTDNNLIDEAIIDSAIARDSEIVTDHGAMSGLSDNDHPQYRLTTANVEPDDLEGDDSDDSLIDAVIIDASIARDSEIVTDHGALTGLGDNDHPQYRLTSADVDPDDLSGDTTDDNLIDDAIIAASIARDSELPSLPLSDANTSDTLTIGASSTVADGALSSNVPLKNASATIVASRTHSDDIYMDGGNIESTNGTEDITGFDDISGADLSASGTLVSLADGWYDPPGSIGVPDWDRVVNGEVTSNYLDVMWDAIPTGTQTHRICWPLPALQSGSVLGGLRIRVTVTDVSDLDADNGLRLWLMRRSGSGTGAQVTVEDANWSVNSTGYTVLVDPTDDATDKVLTFDFVDDGTGSDHTVLADNSYWLVASIKMTNATNDPIEISSVGVQLLQRNL